MGGPFLVFSIIILEVPKLEQFWKWKKKFYYIVLVATFFSR